MCLVDDLLYLLSHTAEPATLEKQESIQVNLDFLYFQTRFPNPQRQQIWSDV